MRLREGGREREGGRRIERIGEGEGGVIQSWHVVLTNL